MLIDRAIRVVEDAPVPTWFHAGGRADALARPADEPELEACMGFGGPVRVLGEGANLLVDDAGVDGLVVRLEAPAWRSIEIDPRTGLVRAGAGADLRRLINETTRAGLAGLEGLGGIPASVGGAVRMNAGGRWGEIAEVVSRVRVMSPGRGLRTLERDEIGFGYRTSELAGAIVTSVELELEPGADSRELRARYRDVLRGKSGSQPMREKSAGCCFKNPALPHGLPGVGMRGQRVSAGLLIDRAGCKGLAVGGARVSEVHANFMTTRPGARARDALELMAMVGERVLDRFGVALEREIVVWSRSA